jgi:hypothetical protein
VTPGMRKLVLAIGGFVEAECAGRAIVWIGDPSTGLPSRMRGDNAAMLLRALVIEAQIEHTQEPARNAAQGAAQPSVGRGAGDRPARLAHEKSEQWT